MLQTPFSELMTRIGENTECCNIFLKDVIDIWLLVPITLEFLYSRCI